MKEQFVTYEIALKLKELGFDEDCLGYYTITNKGLLYPYNMHEYIYRKDFLCTAPLWQQVWSFLDDNGVTIGIIFVDNVFKYTLNIENYVSNEFKDRMSVIKSATEYATSYLWNKKFNK